MRSDEDLHTAFHLKAACDALGFERLDFSLLACMAQCISRDAFSRQTRLEEFTAPVCRFSAKQ